MKIRWVIVGLALIVSLSGCKKKVELTEKETEWEDVEVPQHITEKINDNIMIDSDVVVTAGFEDGKADIYSISEKMVDKKKALEVLSKGRKIVSEKKEKFEDGLEIDHYQFDNGDKLALYDDWIYYSSSLSDYLAYCIRFSDGQYGYNKDKFLECNEDFEFMTLNQANDKCLQLAKDLGISLDEKNGEKVRLPHELLKEEEDVIVMEGIPEEENPKSKEQWREEDDCYLFKYAPLIGSDALLTDVSVPDTERVRGISDFQMQYNKNGIVLLAGGEQFRIEETLKSQVPLMNLNAALEKLRLRFKEAILKDKFTITRISIGNLCMNMEDSKRYETLPVWEFHVKQEDLDTNAVSSWDIIFDATSGKEIY